MMLKKRIFFLLTLFVGLVFWESSAYAAAQNDQQPVTETYTKHDRARSGIALGGIGTGSVELRKDGQFYNWSIFNNYPLGSGPVFTIPQRPRNGWESSLMFFIVRYQVEGEQARLKLLQINDGLDEGGLESIDYYYPWMEAIEKIEYSGRFPFVNMKFTDSEMPLDIEMKAFNPFIPHDVKNSSLPGIYFDFEVTSTSDKNVDVMILASQRNLVGYDDIHKYFVTDLVEEEDYTYFKQTVGGMDTDRSDFGEMGIASVGENTSYYLGWEHKHPYYEKLLVEKQLANINDTEGRNMTYEKTGEKIGRLGNRTKDQRCFSSIARSEKLSPGNSFDHSFVMAWHFPNAYGSHNAPQTEEMKNYTFEGDYILNRKITKNQGHYYSNFFDSASEVVDYMVNNKEELTARTRQFVEDFYASDLDHFVLNQVNSNLNTFITSSTLTKEMKFGIREGMTPDKSWGPNATIDVSLYGSAAIVALYPELQKNMMRQHRDLQTDEGEINHGLGYDLDYTQNGTWGVYHRMDMPGNYVQQVLRDYFWTNDKEYLEEMWPSIKKAISYVTDERDEDGDDMPDMTGIMSSYDNFPMYGLASYLQSQWLCSMKGAVEAAKTMEDKSAAREYRKIFKKGSKLMDKHLWNGEYYRLSKDYSGLCEDIEGATEVDEGCLTDQIVGQWMANMSGLGYLFKEEHVKKSLEKVMEMSYIDDFGLRNCTWPEHPDLYPIHETDLWVDQANTPWTGVELAFASFLIYEDMVDEGLKVIKSVDDRYREAGLYWDHQEFGGHYYRPMSSWAIMNAFLGLSAKEGVYSFAPKVDQEEFKVFFSNSNGTAHYEKTPDEVKINVLTGDFTCNAVRVSKNQISGITEVRSGSALPDYEISEDADNYIVTFRQPVSIKKGNSLALKR